MKLALLLLCLLYSFAALPQSPEGKVLKDKLFVKLKDNGFRRANWSPGDQVFNDPAIKDRENAFRSGIPELSGIYLVTIDTLEATGEEVIQKLNNNPEVEYAEYVPLYETSFDPNDEHYDRQYNLDAIDAENAWNVTRGSNDVVVAVVDDAVLSTHQDLVANIYINSDEVPGNGIDDDGNGYIDDVSGYDVSDDDNNADPPARATSSEFAHGTHCAGIVSASSNNTDGVASIGFRSRLLPVKTAPDSTTGETLPDAYKGVEYAIAAGADIISMSWGGYRASNTYQLLMESAHNRGIVLIAAAGNSNVDIRMYPAGYDHVIAVASSNSSDQKSSFSNYGDWIDVTAPGSSIYSTVPGTALYDYKSGTSMACPLVSGTAALMIAVDPDVTPDVLEQCLKSSSDDISAQNPSYQGELGAGRINAFNAVVCLSESIVANFNSPSEAVCAGSPVQFTNTSVGSGITSYSWTFENGTPATSSQENPEVTFPSAGSYDVTLEISDGNTTSSVTKTVTVNTVTGELSGDQTIFRGNPAFLELELTGDGPWEVVYTDGENNHTLNPTVSPFFFSVYPSATTTYSLVSVSSETCTSSGSGTAEVEVNEQSACDLPGSRFNATLSFDGETSILPPLNINNRLYYTGVYGDSIYVSEMQDDQVLETTLLFGSGNSINLKEQVQHEDQLIISGNYNGAASLIFIDTTLQNAVVNTYDDHHGLARFRPIMIQDDELYAAGHVDSSGNGLEALIAKTDLSGNVIWSTKICGDRNEWLTDISPSHDGNILVCGTTSSNTIGGTHDFLLAKYDTDGNELWTRKVGTGADDMSRVMHVNSDGEIYLFGTTITDGDRIIWIVMLNPDGDPIWSRTIGRSKDDLPFDVVYSEENDILFVSGYTVEEGLNQPYYMTLDTAGDILDQRGFAFEYETVYNYNKRLTILEDNSVVIVGSTADPEGNKSYIIKTDPCGTTGCSTWDPEFSLTTNSVQTKDGGFEIVKGVTTGNIPLTSKKITITADKVCEDPVSDTCFNYIRKIGEGEGGFSATLDEGDQFGKMVADIGDLDNDGVADMVATAHLDDDEGTDAGAVYVLFMNSDGTVKDHQKISNTSPELSDNAFEPGSVTGTSVESLGDLDGDGVTDLAVGAPRDNTEGKWKGAVHILFLNTDGTVKHHSKITKTDDELTAEEGLGTSLALLGDLDGDGVQDIASGAYRNHNSDGDRVGAVHVMFLNTDGTLKKSTKIASNIGGLDITLDDDEHLFGASMASLGDIDDDGTTDIAVGAHMDDDGGSQSGAVYILFLNSDGTVKQHSKISAASPLLADELEVEDLFGYSMGAIGDIDDNGVTDLAVSALNDDDAGTDAGALYFLNLASDGSLVSLRKETGNNINWDVSDGTRICNTVKMVSDYTGDGRPDLTVGTGSDDLGGTDKGSFFLLGGCADPVDDEDPCPLYISDIKKVSSTEGNFTAELDDSDIFGNRIESIGDLNGDGIPEIVASATHDDDGGSDIGAVYILFMNTDGEVSSHQKISTLSGGFNGDPENIFGWDVEDIGDLNNDGVPDIAVSSRDDEITNDERSVWILFLNSDGTVLSEQHITSNTGGFSVSLDPVDNFGFNITNIGDLNGDGVTDLAVGVPYSDNGGTDKGGLYILFMNTDGTVDSHTLIAENTGGFDVTLNSGDLFGYKVTLLGDINENGRTDIAASVFSAEDGTNQGAVWFLELNANGSVFSHKKFLASSADVILEDSDFFGYGLHSLGDINNDGFHDIAIGAHNDDGGGTDRGSVFILSIDENFDPVRMAQFNSLTDGLDTRLDDQDRFGRAIGGMINFNQDSASYLIVSAINDDDGGTDRGAFYLLQIEDSCSSFCSVTAAASAEHPQLCFGDSTLLQNNSTGASSYMWLENNALISTDEEPFFSRDDAGTYEIVLIAQSSDGCSDMDTIQVEIYEKADPLINPGDTTICNGTDVVLSASGLNSYTWSPSASLSCTSCSNPVATPPGNTWYYVTGEDQNGCTGEDSVFVTTACCYNGSPAPVADFDQDTLYCLDETVDILNQSYNSPSATYTWEVTFPSGTRITKTTRDFNNLLLNETGRHNIKLIVDDSCGQDELEEEFIVFKNPESPYVSRYYCEEKDTIRISVIPVSAFSYSWSPAAGLSSPDVADPVVDIDNAADRYFVTIRNEETGCSTEDTVRLFSYETEPAYAGNDTTIQYGSHFRLNGCCGPEYSWTPANSLDNPQVKDPLATPDETTWYRLITTDTNGCTSSDSVRVALGALEVFVPDLFSPDGDGNNDLFRAYSSVPVDIQLQVFNRYGEKVYDSASDGGDGWDGTYKGTAQPGGTYVWKISGRLPDGNEVEFEGSKTGSLNLIR